MNAAIQANPYAIDPSLHDFAWDKWEEQERMREVRDAAFENHFNLWRRFSYIDQEKKKAREEIAEVMSEALSDLYGNEKDSEAFDQSCSRGIATRIAWTQPMRCTSCWTSTRWAGRRQSGSRRANAAAAVGRPAPSGCRQPGALGQSRWFRRKRQVRHPLRRERRGSGGDAGGHRLPARAHHRRLPAFAGDAGISQKAIGAFDMADYGLIRSYETYGDLTRIVLGTPRAFDFPERVVGCDTRRFLQAIAQAGGEWEGLCVEYTIDPTVNLITSLAPIPESRRPASSN